MDLNGHVERQKFGPFTSGPMQGVKGWSGEGMRGDLRTTGHSDYDLGRAVEVKRS